MKIFSKLYDKMIIWSKHRHAPYYLAGISFAEASFFPIPPDVMLLPMALAKPHRAWWYATVATACSVLGGLLGYLVGMLFLAAIFPVLQHLGYVHALHQAQAWFKQYGVWIVFIAAFSPVPFKIFTIAAGSLFMPIFPFIGAAIVGRGGRFFLEALLLRFGGEHIDRWLRRSIDWVGWVILALIVAVYLLYKLKII